jgi:hypothetical protein
MGAKRTNVILNLKINLAERPKKIKSPMFV